MLVGGSVQVHMLHMPKSGPDYVYVKCLGPLMSNDSKYDKPVILNITPSSKGAGRGWTIIPHAI